MSVHDEIVNFVVLLKILRLNSDPPIIPWKKKTIYCTI
jgi:hypothetical protein